MEVDVWWKVLHLPGCILSDRNAGRVGNSLFTAPTGSALPAAGIAGRLSGTWSARTMLVDAGHRSAKDAARIALPFRLQDR
ncbi:hypothetical protein [Agrobacterium arsenijevicii]|uniref:hypothetical protein n=1 Tax=Agrobacterium arsenijevicii TaxID=1585697 RepID=UPI0033063CA1